jgi:hypothetical protein
MEVVGRNQDITVDRFHVAESLFNFTSSLYLFKLILYIYVTLV